GLRLLLALRVVSGPPAHLPGDAKGMVAHGSDLLRPLRCGKSALPGSSHRSFDGNRPRGSRVEYQQDLRRLRAGFYLLHGNHLPGGLVEDLPSEAVAEGQAGVRIPVILAQEIAVLSADQDEAGGNPPVLPERLRILGLQIGAPSVLAH